MLLLAGVGFLGAVDTVGRVKAWAQHLLLPLAVTTTHRLDDIIQTRLLLLILFLHTHFPLYYLLSIIYYLLSIICYLLSLIYYLLSIICLKP